MEETEEKKSNGYGKRPLGQWILIYVVLAVIVYGAFYYFFLAKKGSNNYTSTPATTQAPSPTKALQTMNVVLDSVNNSSESGTATLTEEDGKTTVKLTLTGFVKDVQQPAHIHVGSCPGVGAVKYPLTGVLNGQSSTVLPVTLSQLKKDLPLAINVHKSKEQLSVYTACGPLNAK